MLRQFIFACLFSFIIAQPARAVVVPTPLTLDDIISSSAIAFQGSIIEYKTESEPQTGFIICYTTFKVQEVLKGTVEATYTMKESMPLCDQTQHSGVSKLVDGKSKIYFLYGVSESGFSSPVALGRGVFSIIQDAAVLSDFSPPASEQSIISPAPAGLEHIGLEEFKQLVRQKIGM
ncbi:MAG: hypothetical protein DID92_2727744441 [Candidatus Nitrotoga sp. SPKER]|nr:MAG: hypothetical protein DID92_2727744441 [Candidatus Nitrotoga sp. SPKER]